MKRGFLSVLLTLALLCQGLWPAWPARAEEYRAVEVMATTSESEFWLETTYAMAGSATGYMTALMSFGLLALTPGFLAKAGEEPADLTSSPLVLLLLALPVLATSAALYFFYPLPKGKQADLGLTLLGSFMGLLVSGLALLPLILSVQGESVGQSVIQLAPLGFFLGVLLQGLAATWFFDMSKSWKVEISQFHPGFTLVHQFRF